MSTLVTTRPEPSPPVDWTFPTVQRVEAPGVRLVAAHLTGRSLIRVRVLADAGAVNDPTGREGLAQIVSAVMLRGAKGLDEEGLAIAFEMGGAEPSASAGYDSATMAVRAPSALLGGVVDLLAEVARRPALEAAQVGRVVGSTVDSLAAAQAQPGHRADVAARQEFFVPESRYAMQARGVRDTIRAITHEDVLDFHAARWGQAPLTVVVVGDLDGVDLDGVASAFSIDGATVDRGRTVATPAGVGPRIALVDVPGSVQSVLDITATGPAYEIPDAPDLAVAQAVVLSAFTARVNQRLREELGYTYGARGSFDRLRDGGTLNVGMQVRTEVTADAVRETMQILRTSVDNGLDDDEVEQARDNLVSRFPVSYDGASAVAAALVNREVHGLEDDERDVMLARLKHVTAASATEAWRRYVDLDDVVVTIAGDAGTVRDELRELGAGPVLDR